jgi:peroxiredoxin Q/BCP
MKVTAVGISPDKALAQKRFSEKNGFGFPLLSDADHKASKSHGVWGEKTMYGKKLRESSVPQF